MKLPQKRVDTLKFGNVGNMGNIGHYVKADVCVSAHVAEVCQAKQHLG
jgi:hypothetical protein